MALLQPVAPNSAPAGYQVAGTLGPSPTQDLLAQLAQQHQAALSAAKSGPVAPVMPTAAELQAQLQARTGISGPQYNGAGLGSTQPVVPEGYTQVGNRLLSPDVQAVQAAQQAAVDPAILAAQDKIANSGMKDYQQNIAQTRLTDQLAQSGTPGFQSTADKAANWQARQADINNRAGYTAAGKAPAYSQQNPLDPKTHYARSVGNTAGVRNAQYQDALRVAQAKYYQDRSNAMAAAQNKGFSFGNLASALNPFAGVQRMASGSGRPGDYLKLASLFL